MSRAQTRYLNELNPIRVERRKQRLTIEGLAQRSGVTRRQIEHSETCKKADLGVRLAKKIAGGLGVSWTGMIVAWAEWREAIERDPARMVMALHKELRREGE